MTAVREVDPGDDLRRLCSGILQREITRLEMSETQVRVLRSGCGDDDGRSCSALFVQDIGPSEVTLSDGSFELAAGDILIVPEALPWVGRVAAADSSGARTMVCGVQPGQFSACVAELDGESVNGASLCRAELWFGAAQNLPSYVRDAADLSVKGGPHARSAAHHLLIALLHRMLLAIRASTPEVGSAHPLVREAMLHINASIGSPTLSVAGTATRIRCAPDYLSALFRRETGATVSSYIEERRISRGIDLLRRTDLRVMEVARACGYRNQGYFCRVFHRIAGTTPSAYRQRMQRDSAGQAGPEEWRATQ